MAVQLVTPPTAEPITLVRAKLHLRVDFDDDNDLIQDMIITAREVAETETRRALMTQTWKYILDAFPANPQPALTWQGDQDRFRLPFPPLQSVTSIVYTDQNGTPGTVSPSVYQVDTASEPGRIALNPGQVWPSVALATIAGVAVTFVAGYTSADQVPRSLKQGMLLLIGAYYRNREDWVVDKQIKSLEMPRGVASLFLRNAVPEAA